MNTFDLVRFSAYRYGHTRHEGGFSGAFSWWRDALTNSWHWCGCEFGFAKTGGRAVVDDFGNLVAVSS